jgi:hypothetical protein
MVSIPIYASSATLVSGGSITFRIDMRTDLLTPESVTSPIVGAGTAPLQVDDSGVWITLNLLSNVSISTDTLLVTLVCRVFVTDTNETAITVANLSASTANCLSILGTGGVTLTQFLLTGSPLTITSIVPNPAQDAIEIRVVGGIPASQLQIEMYDVLGRGQDVRNTSLRNGISLDVSNLPSGIYFIRLSLGGYVESRSVVIQK